MVLSFNAIQNVILIFPDERPVFLREANNGMYRVSAYFWAKILSELPIGILTPALFSATVYFAIGYNTEEWFKFPLFGKYAFHDDIVTSHIALLLLSIHTSILHQFT